MTRNRATTSKSPEEPRAPREAEAEQLQTAYRIHTLAQMIYSRMASAPPWAAASALPAPVPGRGYEPFVGVPPTVGWVGPAPTSAVGFESRAALRTMGAWPPDPAVGVPGIYGWYPFPR